MNSQTKALIVAATEPLKNSTFVDIYGNKANDYFNREMGYLLSVLEDSINDPKKRDLTQCTPKSIKESFRDVILLGLSLNPTSKQANLIPYGKICKMQTQYRGDRDFLVLNGIVKNITAEVVYEKDDFQFSNELQNGRVFQNWKHTPTMGTRGALQSVYAIITFTDGSTVIRLYHKDDVLKRMKVAKTDKIWKAWPAMMWKKTAIRMASNEIPRTKENREILSRWEDQDNQHSDLDKKPDTEGEMVVNQSAFDKLESLRSSNQTTGKKIQDAQALMSQFSNVKGFADKVMDFIGDLEAKAQAEKDKAAQDSPITDVEHEDISGQTFEEWLNECEHFTDDEKKQILKSKAKGKEAKARAEADKRAAAAKVEKEPEQESKAENTEPEEDPVVEGLKQELAEVPAGAKRLSFIYESQDNMQRFMPYMGSAWLTELMQEKAE